MELSKMKKSLPLEKSRPDSAVSSKMYLTIQRLTLQVRATYLGGGLRQDQAHLSLRQNWFSVYTLFCPASLDPRGLDCMEMEVSTGRWARGGMPLVLLDSVSNVYSCVRGHWYNPAAKRVYRLGRYVCLGQRKTHRMAFCQ